MTPKLVKIYIKRDNTVRRLTSWKVILCWADHLHVTVYIRKSQKYAVKNIINIGSSKKLLHGYGIYLSLHTRYKPQNFVCLQKRGMLHVHVHQECIIVLVAYVEIISTFILIFANSIMDDFHINTEDVMVHFWPYHQYNCTYVCVVLAEGYWSIGEEYIEYINYRVTTFIE